MFGFEEYKMEMYLDCAQDYAVQEVAPKVLQNSKFIVPATMKGKEVVANATVYKQLLTDVETIVTLTMTSAAYNYAFLQAESEMAEEAIIKHLHDKYDSYVLMQFIKYGIAFTSEAITEIVGEIILELPYLFGDCLDEDDEEGKELEKRLEAYNEYLDTYFYTETVTDEDFEEEEEAEDIDE